MHRLHRIPDLGHTDVMASGQESESMKAIKPGDPVVVRLFDSRTVQGTICVGGILNTVGGTKIRVRSGDAVYLVNPEQIIGATLAKEAHD